MTTESQARDLTSDMIAKSADGREIVEWVAMALLSLNILFALANLVFFTMNPNAYAGLGCETTYYLPSSVCFWTKPLPVPGTITSRADLFLPVTTPEAVAGRNFALLMLGAVGLSIYGLATNRRWGGWLTALTVVVAVSSGSRWNAIPVDPEGVGQMAAVLFVLSMVVLSIVGLYGLLQEKEWVRGLLIAGGAYGTLIGAFWVVVPVVLIQVLLGVVLILLLLERQGGYRPAPLAQRLTSWLVIPLLIVIVLLILHQTFIAPATGFLVDTLNWKTIFQRTLEHIKVVLVASLAAIATAVPVGILITRDYKFSTRVRRISTAIPQAVLIGAGYAVPWIFAWWLQDPVEIESTGDLLNALTGPVFWALLVGGGIHWLIYSQTKARPEWGAIDSWRSLGPTAINIANVGQTVPGLAVLGLSMSFLGIGFTPAIFALWIRALLPILRNTVAGIISVDQDIIEAARGMGMSRSQVLFQVELPLAMAVIFAGIRTSVVFNVGVGALAFFIGAGGLGTLIAIGIALSNNPILMVGGVLTAVLAIAVDFVTGHMEERLVPPSAA